MDPLFLASELLDQTSKQRVTGTGQRTPGAPEYIHTKLARRVHKLEVACHPCRATIFMTRVDFFVGGHNLVIVVIVPVNVHLRTDRFERSPFVCAQPARGKYLATVSLGISNTPHSLLLGHR